jgi:cytoskeleton protein RodZ
VEGKRAESANSLGATLRQARESRGLSVDEAAQALRLSARIVTALEECAFERLPGPTYVRGYLRNYAQFLGLAPQPLVDVYGRLPQATQQVDMTAPAPVRQVTSSDMLVRLGTGVVVLVMFGLAALWWIGHDKAKESPKAPESTSAAVKQVPAVAPAPRETVGEEQERPATAAEPSAKPTVAAVESTPPAPSAKPPTPEPPVAAPPNATPTESTTNAPTSQLVLYVHEDSWADVRDAQQHRLLYETIPAGRVVSVEGVAPLSVFLGNVEGVTVEFNGQPYDALRHKRGQVARFTLGLPPG